MKTYIVTIKLSRNPSHDPRNKVIGPCPADASSACTDATGEHHSILMRSPELPEALARLLRADGVHVTRIEEVT